MVARLTFATGCPHCRKRGGIPAKDPPIDLAAFEPYRKVVDLERAIWKTAPANLPKISTGLVRPGLRRVAGVEFKRPERETFHEFLFAFLKQQMPEGWFESQLKLAEPHRHQIVRWYDGIPRLKANPSGARLPHPGGTWSDTPSGDVQCLLATAWDVYCLFQANCLPKSLLKRLFHPAEFQGARYEIAVGATFVRAGCSLEWVKDVEGQSRPEFVATHNATGAKVAVEAKSRQRPGVLGRPGKRDPSKEGRGDFWNLLQDARAKDVKELPFIIFVDMNAAPEPGVPLDERSWWSDYLDIVEALPVPEPAEPDKVNAMFITNFAYHYAGAEATPPGTQRPGISLYPLHSFPPAAMTDISLAAGEYGHPPID